MSNSAEKQNSSGLKVLIAGAVLQLFLGIIYVWSVFVKPVSHYYGWFTVSGDWVADYSAVKLTASFMLCFFVIGILTGGKLQTKIGAKLTVLTGGLMVSAGMLATALIPQGKLSLEHMFSSSMSLEGPVREAAAPVFLIYLFYGIIGGFGVGMAYNAIVSSAQKWFPKKRGMVTGVVVCSFGLSTVIFAPLVETLNRNFAVNTTFMILSGVFALATLSIFSFIKMPEQVSNASAPVLKGKQYSTFEMLKTPRYYLLTLSLMFGTSVFFIINPSLKELAINRGIADFATYLVMFTGIANALGRLGAPMLSDKIGRESADIIILMITALGAFGLCFAEGALLIAVIALVAFCYGGYSGLYPVLTSENFGLKNVGSNYGAVMVGFMLSALLFPIVLNKIENQTVKFIILGALAVIGAFLVIVLKIINTRRGEQRSPDLKSD
ncbi:MAG: MFS transporter [Oscillospiraceae bacterium]|nr:MFS transporter [Oscillospiraceae bacterium]